MKKVFLTAVLFSVICGNIFSQTEKKLSESEKAAFVQKMVAHSKKINTLQCNFVQTKTSTLVSEKSVTSGILLYRSASALRWEYTAPTPSTLILNGNDAIFFDRHGKRQGNTAVLKQLGGIIISMINGKSLQQSKQFASEVFENEVDFTVVLTPLQKRLKDYYKSLEMKLDKDSFLASEIVLLEKSGDTTVIILNGILMNTDIESHKFAVE